MIEAIRHGLGNLLRFSGRDSRTTFWFYVLFLALVYFAVSMVLGIFAGGSMMLDVFHNVSSSSGPDETAMMAAMKDRMVSAMRVSFWGSAVMSLVLIALGVAAFVRRLHDSGKPGWIAALAVAFKLLAMIGSIRTIGVMSKAFETLDFQHPETFQAQMQAQALTQYSSLTVLIGWVPLLIVLVFGCMASADGANRYGPEPDDF